MLWVVRRHLPLRSFVRGGRWWLLAALAAASHPDDRDRDGLSDGEELRLASRLAPVVYHDEDEPNFPIDVADFLRETELWFYDAGCAAEHVEVADRVAPQELARFRFDSPCLRAAVLSGASRSATKQHTFYLSDVAPAHRAGSDDATRWPTYVHVYPTEDGGVCVQYWRFYPYNTGRAVSLAGIDLELGFHGGDWEGIHVVLRPDRSPALVRYLGHAAIDSIAWDAAPREGSHTVVFVQPGSHTSRPLPDGLGSRRVRQETWAGGIVRWPDGRVQRSAGLVNVGEKLTPLAPWLRYAGLWGSPGFNLVRLLGDASGANFSSGYWGPAYNETGMGPDGFHVAWCAGAAHRSSAAGGVRECYAESVP